MYYPYIDQYQLYENLPSYILISVIMILIMIFIYIKLMFPFWNSQPVYHSYDFWRTLYSNPFLIHKRFSTKLFINKFCDLKNIETFPFVDVSENDKNQIIDLLQCFYLESENSMFVFNRENLEAYLSGHIYSSYISLLYDRSIKQINDEKPTACISSRSGELYINIDEDLHNIDEISHTKQMMTPIYYIDLQCMKRDTSPTNKTKIMRTLFQTHIYKQQFIDDIEGCRNIETNNSKIIVSIFRKERELLSGIVPLSRFKTTYYNMSDMARVQSYMNPFPQHFILVEINSSNMDILFDFLEDIKIKNRFSVFARTDLTNLRGLITSGNLYVYCLKRLDTIYSMYIFRDSRTNYEYSRHNKLIGNSVLQLLASINNSSSQDLFINGCLHSMSNIVKKMPVYKILMVDNITDNIVFTIKYNISRVIDLVDSYMSAYYLYNMVIPWAPVPGSRLFLIF